MDRKDTPTTAAQERINRRADAFESTVEILSGLSPLDRDCVAVMVAEWVIAMRKKEAK